LAVGHNAGLLAVQILAPSDESLREKVVRAGSATPPDCTAWRTALRSTGPATPRLTAVKAPTQRRSFDTLAHDPAKVRRCRVAVRLRRLPWTGGEPTEGWHMVKDDDLKEAYLFAAMSPNQLRRVAARAARIHVDAGGLLFSVGEPADRFFLVVKGQVKLYRQSGIGKEKVIEIVGPGSTFAESFVFLTPPRYGVSCAALLPTELIAIDAPDFTAMLRGSVDTCMTLLGGLSQRLRGLIAEIDRLSLQTATCRIAGFLLERAPDGSDEYLLDVQKNVVAAHLSVEPATLSRILRRLSDRGVVSVHGSLIQVLDRPALRREAEASGALLAPTDPPVAPPCA
jgi:CRP-like cAMP-binding protein